MAAKRHAQPRPKPSCSICTSTQALLQTNHGWVCEPCTTRLREGKDATTGAVRDLQRSMRHRSRALKEAAQGGPADAQRLYEAEVLEVMALDTLQHPESAVLTHGGEAMPTASHALHDTMVSPTTTALDASVERLNLVSAFGTDAAALALDAAESIRASNSLEKMLAHQLAVAHRTCMDLLSKAALESDPARAIKQANLAARLMDVYQRGLVTLKRMRSAGEQQITVQHVHIASGAQAVVGTVKTGGAQ